MCVNVCVCVCFIWDSLAPWWDFKRFCLTKPSTHCQIHEQSIKINFWTAKYKWLACQQCRWSPTAPKSVIGFPLSLRSSPTHDTKEHNGSFRISSKFKIATFHIWTFPLCVPDHSVGKPAHLPGSQLRPPPPHPHAFLPLQPVFCRHLLYLHHHPEDDETFSICASHLLCVSSLYPTGIGVP